MENQDLGSKKMNNKSLNEGFSGEHISKNYNPSSVLKSELEIDENGNKKIVERARTKNDYELDLEKLEQIELEENKNRGVSSEKEIQKTIENKDLNSDITTNRYPNSNLDNKINRGNIDLD